MSEDGSGKRRAPGTPVSERADSTPLAAGSRATPTDLLRKLVGPQSPMAVRMDESERSLPVVPPPPARVTPSELAAHPTEPGFAPPEPPSRPLTSVRQAFVPVEEPPTTDPFAAEKEERGRLPSSDAPFTASLIERSRRRFRPHGGLIAFVASAIVGVLLVLLFRTSDGKLMVTAGGPSNAPLAAARVELDGRAVCENVPCRIEGVSAGEHRIVVQALGYRVPNERSVTVRGGAELASHFTLEPEATATIDVRVDAPGLRIYVDGQDRGPAPGRVTGLAATAHFVELLDNSLFAPFEQRVELRAGEVKLVEPTLTLQRGAIVLRPGKGAKDASVFLERDGELRRVPSLPMRIEVAPLGGYRILATRRGFEDFERIVGFSIARPEVEVLVELQREGESAASGEPTPEVSFESLPAEPSAPSVLTLESTPSCSIVLDGRPVGKTPQTLPVAPGSHSVVFIHPTLGRKSVTVRAKSGEPSSASVQF